MNPAVLGQTNTWHITFLASFLIWLMFFGVVVMWVIDGRIKKEHALHAFFSLIVAWIFVEIIKSFVPVLRPFNLNGDTPLTLRMHEDSSFPSGHSALAFAMAMSIYLRDRKLGLYFAVAAFLVAIGRVWSNVHFVVDVIVGAMIGVSTALVLEKMNLGRLLKR